MAKKGDPKPPEQIVIPALNRQTLKVKVIGTAPLLINKWSEKAKQQIVDKQAKKAQKARPVRDPKAEFQAAMYMIDKKTYGVPAMAFKNAMVRACMDVSGISQVQARGLFFVLGDLLPLKTKGPVMDERFVRLKGMGNPADIRYRPRFDDWECTLLIEYDADSISKEQLLNLLNRSGYSVGVGEMRARGKESTGNFGRYTVEQA